VFQGYYVRVLAEDLAQALAAAAALQPAARICRAVRRRAHGSLDQLEAPSPTGPELPLLPATAGWGTWRRCTWRPNARRMVHGQPGVRLASGARCGACTMARSAFWAWVSRMRRALCGYGRLFSSARMGAAPASQGSHGNPCFRLRQRGLRLECAAFKMTSPIRLKYRGSYAMALSTEQKSGVVAQYRRDPKIPGRPRCRSHCCPSASMAWAGTSVRTSAIILHGAGW